MSFGFILKGVHEDLPKHLSEGERARWNLDKSFEVRIPSLGLDLSGVSRLEESLRG